MSRCGRFPASRTGDSHGTTPTDYPAIGFARQAAARAGYLTGADEGRRRTIEYFKRQVGG